MTETGVVLPWWLLSLFAGVLLTVGVWRQESLRRWCAQRLSGAAEQLHRWCNRLELHLARLHIRTDDAFASFATYLAAMRYQMAVIDFNRLLTTRWQRTENLCTDSDGLIAQAAQELENAKLERPDAPEWVVAADAIGKLPAGNSQPATSKILEAMLSAANTQHEEALREFRWAAAVRARALLASAAYWRKLNARLEAIEAYWCDIRNSSQHLAKAGAYAEQSERESRRRRLVRGVGNGLVATALLAVSAWVTVFLLGHFRESLSAAGSQWPGAWSALYLIGLLLLGSLVICALRCSDVFPGVAELPARWRRSLVALGLALLVATSMSSMELVAADLFTVQVAAGWSEGSARWLSGLLYLMPLLLASQLCLLAHWLRSTKPLSLLALESVIRMLTLLLKGVEWLARAAYRVVALKGQMTLPAGAEPIKLVADNSGKRANS
ncbi:hypothetical protein FHR99_001125 [Litorivivens lipolytica]|uniref:Uncharacterized protein n=1 Tax=Litorivivens lipolytica TaxID=1524264 RepID=A0A7W4W4S6_9GAMM|nr:hypothetical protein [Litorivivens lipolytica]MBB3046889.1 hypothetical protein [Litorivivens lipolytica]